MFNCFLPDFMFDRFDDVTPEFLRENGIKYLLIDIDNTLAPYEEPTPNERVKAWFSLLNDAGVKSVLVSNNNEERVQLFNKELSLPAFANCCKPSPRRLKKYAAVIGADLMETAALGDQIFTDVYGAKKMGARAILVSPIKDKKSLFFKAKRLLEKPFLRKYKKLHGGENGKN